MQQVLVFFLAFALWLGIGIMLGTRWCAHKNHCIQHQRKAVKKWTKDITDEITPKMQERLAHRERARAKEDEDLDGHR